MRTYSSVPFSQVAVTGPFWRKRLDTVLARPAVQRGIAAGAEHRKTNDMKDPSVHSVLFGQRAR